MSSSDWRERERTKAATICPMIADQSQGEGSTSGAWMDRRRKQDGSSEAALPLLRQWDARGRDDCSEWSNQAAISNSGEDFGSDIRQKGGWAWGLLRQPPKFFFFFFFRSGSTHAGEGRAAEEVMIHGCLVASIDIKQRAKTGLISFQIGSKRGGFYVIYLTRKQPLFWCCYTLRWQQQNQREEGRLRPIYITKRKRKGAGNKGTNNLLFGFSA